jgi:hypothetical protein
MIGIARCSKKQDGLVLFKIIGTKWLFGIRFNCDRERKRGF